MTFRIIALDLDGTVLTPQKTILPETLEALQHARDAGYQVIIVTGRHHIAIHPFYQALQLDTPAICCNGTYLYDYHTRRVLSADPLTPEQATALIDMLHDRGIHGLMYVDEAMMYETATGHILRTQNWVQRLPENQRPTFTQVPSLREAVRTVNAIWKFALTDENVDRLNACATEVEATLGLACEWSWQDQVDVAQRGNNKGKRLAEWVASQGLTMENVVAFGDNYNDLSMLEPAGLGIAMGNADEAIKARADLVIGDNTTASIAGALYAHLL